VVVDTSRRASAYSTESMETSRHSSAYSAESIEIELTAEGFVLGLVKVEGHDLLDKLVRVVHFECGAVSDPRHNVIQTIFLDVC
jgi:hypothetical protein